MSQHIVRMAGKGAGMHNQAVSRSAITHYDLERWAFICAGIVTGLFAIASIALPFGWDHGIMASVGSTYLHGKLPYADGWDMKGPVAFLPYTLTQALFGPTMWGIRIFDLVIGATAAYILYDGVRALAGWRVGAWAAFGYYFWIASAGWFFTATPEAWVGALCIVAIVPLLRPELSLSLSQMALTGALVGWLGMMKPFYIVLGVVPLLSIFVAPKLALTRRAILALALALGAAVPIALVLAYFAIHGDLAKLVEVHVLYTLTTYAHVSSGLAAAVYGTGTFLAQPTVALAAPFAALGVWVTRKSPRVLWPGLGWLAVMLFCVAVQRKFWAYQWMPVYAPLSFLAALGAGALVRSEAAGRVPLIFTVLAGVTFAAQVCALPMHDTAKFFYYFGLKHSPQGYYGSFHYGPYNAADERASASYIIAHTTPGQGVFVWGNDATIRYLSGRPNPTRFTMEMPLVMKGTYLDQYQAEAMRGLISHPPTYIVVGVTWYGNPKEESLATFPAFDAYLHQNYTLEKSFGVDDIYRRNEAGPGIAEPPHG
jgi:Dolichyl-phosphate-mannose-protein mannosyltransferase